MSVFGGRAAPLPPRSRVDKAQGGPQGRAMTSSNGNGGASHNGGGASVRDPELDRARLRAVHGALTAGDIAAAGKLAEDALADGIDHPMVLNLVAGRREEQGRL